MRNGSSWSTATSCDDGVLAWTPRQRRGGNLVTSAGGEGILAGLGERDEAALVTFNEKMQLREDASRDRAADGARSTGETAGGRLIDASTCA